MKPIKEQTSTLKTVNLSQQRFLKYTLLVLLDLTTLNLFNQYWDYVYIETFTISLLIAVLLQILMQTAIHIEEFVAERFFAGKTSIQAKVARGVRAWVIIFISKLIILEIINFAFGTRVLFTGPIDGVAAFLVVVIVIIIVEQSVMKIYRSLEDENPKRLE
jgi:hypothetical protein